MTKPRCGVYKIINLINGKFYIGSSVNLSRRKAEHKYRRKNNIYMNSILKNATKKYGESNMSFEIIEELEFGDWASKQYKLELVTSREQFYVDILKPKYNIRKDVTSNTNCASEATLRHIEKLRDINRGRTDAKFPAKRVQVYNTKGELIDICANTKEASIKYHIDSSNISRSCTGQRKINKKSAVQYNFKYVIS